MSDRKLVTCANGHRCTVPADAISAPGAAALRCPVCGLGVPSEKASTRITGWEGYVPEAKSEAAAKPRGLNSEYLESMRAFVDEGGQLSHRNGLDLLAELERLNAQ